jgi:hypothetical protein
MRACVFDSLLVHVVVSIGRLKGGMCLCVCVCVRVRVCVCVCPYYLPLDLLMMKITCGWNTDLFAIPYC